MFAIFLDFGFPDWFNSSTTLILSLDRPSLSQYHILEKLP
jgi:hypothetical protein